ELAAGGLGVVFVALDSELNREVALKEIQPSHADDVKCRARFILEAEITGRLEHPGIVPIYGLGSDAQGRPFYAMRLIKGFSLKDAIKDFHLDLGNSRSLDRHNLVWQQLLRRFLDLCNAVEFAHSRGILHRDIKPSNVLLGPYGETLLVDWGLAKALRQLETPAQDDDGAFLSSWSSASSKTLPGAAVGTPAYMSPEQAAG